MRSWLHFRMHDEGFLQSHSLHGMLSLIATLGIAMLIVLLTVMSAK
ncbi:MAG TPA: hypothetical protein VEK33_17390 [Terriglobales bacterium]|nr:hypothetical protein [Terriglobales bacterium]